MAPVDARSIDDAAEDVIDVVPYTHALAHSEEFIDIATTAEITEEVDDEDTADERTFNVALRKIGDVSHTTSNIENAIAYRETCEE